MRINIERLRHNLLELGKIGYEEGKGLTRRAFTPAYQKGKIFVRKLMESAGLEVYEDSIGNLFGRIKGKTSHKSIIAGSHIDTVPCGGIFDGSLGVISAIECLQTLLENGFSNSHALEAVVFIDEEGYKTEGTFGSSCFAGCFDREKIESSQFWPSLVELGFTPDMILKARRAPDTIKNYLELHVEQGGILDSEGIPIGIVQGIVGIAAYKATVKGKANHAGTTPMHLRDDALLKACQAILKLHERVKGGEPLVATVGSIHAFPGAINVIPGKVEFPIEIRDMCRKTIEKTICMLKKEFAGLNITLEEMYYEKEAYLDKTTQKVIQKACEKLGYSYKYMFSGAGHDANPISTIAPTGMIFVPSKNGISHSPDEWTDWSDIEKGANVLLETIKLLDKQ